MQHWLVKSEPECYSIADLQRDKVTTWSDVRNYQARNFLRAMQVGDRVLFYHSSCAVPAVVGTATVVKEAYPDPTQFDAKHDGYDAKATIENPRWSTVDVSFERMFREPLTLAELKLDPAFAGMELLKQGSRLSVQPVSKLHFDRVITLRA